MMRQRLSLIALKQTIDMPNGQKLQKIQWSVMLPYLNQIYETTMNKKRSL